MSVKKGDPALLPCTVTYVFPPAHIFGKRIVEVQAPAWTDNGEHIAFTVDADKLHPTPREGEYRLTVDELVELCYDSENYPYFQSDEDRAAFIKQWLAKRKEGRR